MKIIIICLLLLVGCYDSVDRISCEWDGNEYIAVCEELTDGELYYCTKDGYYERCDNAAEIEIQFPCHMYQEEEKPEYCEGE